jgi:hypothetical protein
MKPLFIKILLFWLAKYIGFYVFMMFKTGNYAFIKVNEIKTGEDLFYYLWIFLVLPVVCIFLFSVPMYFIFKLKHFVCYVLIFISVLVAEYFLYTSLASQANLMNGIYNGIISILFMGLFFFRQINPPGSRCGVKSLM